MMETTRIVVTGMTCNHCVEHVTGAIQGVEGVSDVVVSLELGSALIRHTARVADILKAIEAAGYGPAVDRQS